MISVPCLCRSDILPHLAGRSIIVLTYKLCSFIMEYDVHTVLDLFTLAATGWVITMILTKLKSTWQQDKDVLLEAYIVRSRLSRQHA